MPLRDHFRPPLSEDLDWTTVHSGWVTRLADRLNEHWLRRPFIAAEVKPTGQFEIDIATLEQLAPAPASRPSNGPAVGTLVAPVWTPPAPATAVPAVFPTTFEVRVYSATGRRRLVAAIELVSPSNKDRPSERRAFAVKCASFLGRGVSVVILDAVTERRANLHNEIMRLMDAPAEADIPPDVALYAAAYRPVDRGDRTEVEVWTARLAVGEELPTMPLRLTGDLFVPVEFEPPYEETCRRRLL